MFPSLYVEKIFLPIIFSSLGGFVKEILKFLCLAAPFNHRSRC